MNVFVTGIWMLAVAQQVIGASLYEGYVIRDRGVKSVFTASSLDKCVESCKPETGCIAVSYHFSSNTCVRSGCGFVVLVDNCEYTTAIVGNPVIDGQILPTAAHEYALTDQCGTASFGSAATSIGTVNLDYQLKVNALFGSALHFPGKSDGTNGLGLTNPDASFNYYSSKSSSFSVLFYVNIKKSLNGNAALVDFRSAKDLSLGLWFWPDMNTLHFNWFGTTYDNIPIKYQNNTWVHVAFTMDTMSSVLTAYFNGTVVRKVSIAFTDKRFIDRITVGGRSTETNSGVFDGSMYCVSIFNEVLEQHQIFEHQRSCTVGKVRFIGKKRCDLCSKADKM